MGKPSRRRVAEVVADLMDKGVSSAKLAKQLAAYLSSERRTKELEPLMRDVIDIRANRGELELAAISVHELSSSVETALKKLTHAAYPKAQNFIIHSERSPQLISWLLLKYGENELDLSTHGRFKKLTLKGINR